MHIMGDVTRGSMRGLFCGGKVPLVSHHIRQHIYLSGNNKSNG